MPGGAESGHASKLEYRVAGLPGSLAGHTGQHYGMRHAQRPFCGFIAGFMWPFRGER
jgi:hypothetical protein